MKRGLAVLFVLGAGFAAQILGAQGAATPPGLAATAGQALLVRGPERVAGLPFFSPNAISALRGEYLLGKDRLEFWFTREALVFSPPWKEDPALAPALARGARSLRSPLGFVVAWSYPRYTLILAFPLESSFNKGFAEALSRRFGFFFDNAADDAGLSFPALVEF